MKWIKKEAGRYVSEDGRFEINKTWSRTYGNHWELRDKDARDHFLKEADTNAWLANQKATRRRDSLAECKELAERLYASTNLTLIKFY